MKNLKKTLAVVLAFAMVLSMGFSAFAYTDVTAGTKVAEAVGVLSNLGIFTGFEDGTFKPEDTVTRAQMAAIICRTLGYEDQAQSSAGSTIFNDVPASHWASGYVNVAQSLQIVNGYGDGNFGPEDQVTYEQAVKMIVVALGYELDAQSKGGWSTGYLAVASREGITKSANGTVGTPAARGTIAVLVYNSLEVRLMDQDTWTTSGKEDEFKKLNETVLSKYLGVQKWEGVVAATPYSQYVGGYNPDTTPEITLAPGCFYEEWRSGKLTKIYLTDVEGDKEVLAPLSGIDCSLVDVNPYAGKKVVAYIGEEADEETGHRMVYAITEKTGANKVTTIGLNQLVEDGKYWAAEDVIGYKNVGSKSATDLDLDNVVSLVVNFAMVEEDMIDEGINTTEELVEEIGTLNGTISFISNDNDNKIDVIIVTAYTDEAVVEEVTTEDGIISLDFFSNEGDNEVVDEIDTEDEDTLIIVYKDGALAAVEDIAANDTISAVTLDDSFMVLYVSSKTVTGTVEGYDDETVTVAGEEYKLSDFKYAATDELKDKEGIFFLNVAGQIAHDEAEAAKGNYGIVIAAGEGSGVKGGYEVEIALADGTVAVYPLASKAYVEAADGDILQADGTDAETAEEIAAAKKDEVVYGYLTTKLEGTDDRAQADDLANLFFEVKIKNGAISKLAVLAPGTPESGEEEYDEENMAYGDVIFSDSTVVFSIAVDGTDEVEAGDIKVGKVADYFVDGEGGSCTIIAFDEDDRDETAGAILGFGLDTTVALDGDAMIITSAKNISYNDETAVKLTGFQGGKDVTYTLYDDDENYDKDDFAEGDVILVGAANAEGVISTYHSLYQNLGTKFALGANAVANEGKEIEYYAGKVDYEATLTDSTFTIDNTTDVEITMKSAAKYTLVDLTEGDIEVSKKSKGKSIFGSASKYESVVFVRYYDGKLAEVIVYRWDVDAASTVYDNTVFQSALND